MSLWGIGDMEEEMLHYRIAGVLMRQNMKVGGLSSLSGAGDSCDSVDVHPLVGADPFRGWDGSGRSGALDGKNSGR